VAKTIIHIGLSVLRDRVAPGPKQIVSVGAAIGEKGIQINLRPALNQPFCLDESNSFYRKNPELWPQVTSKQEGLSDGLKKFNLWLKQFQGRLIAVVPAMEFYHLYTTMIETIGECEFDLQPLDLRSWLAGQRGTTMWPITIPRDKMRTEVVGVLPVEVAKDRWFVVTHGEVPKFGERKKKSGIGAGAVGAPPLNLADMAQIYREGNNIRIQAPRFQWNDPPPIPIGRRDPEDGF